MRRLFLTAFAICVATAVRAASPNFTYLPAGTLQPEKSGQGTHDNTLYAPSMRFPLKAAPAYANSQVYGIGGELGASGTQCDLRNFQYPWRDNFCERRPG